MQFLYPSEEESYRVLSFLLDKLSKSSSDVSGGRKGHSSGFANESISSSKTSAIVRETIFEDEKQKTSTETAGGSRMAEPTSVRFRNSLPRFASTNAAQEATEMLHGRLSHLALETRNIESAEIGDVRIVGKSLSQHSIISSYLDIESSYLSRELMFGKRKDMVFLTGRFKQEKGEGQADGLVELDQGELRTLEERLHILSTENLKLTLEITEFKEVISKLEIESEASSKQLKLLKEKHDLIKIASELAIDSTQTEESKLLQLKVAIEESQERVADSKCYWDSVHAELERKKSQLELAVVTQNEELQVKLEELTHLQQKINDTTMKLKQREEQLSEVTAELEKVTNGPPRSSYVSRITELIKNSKKQDTDISRIIGETRDLQRESNSNQGRLKRTYAFVDELVFRNAKRDAICRQAYRLLTSIHQDFLDCYDKVFAMDKMRREITDLQATIETLDKRPVDLNRIQADLDALVAENTLMEKSSQAAPVDGAITAIPSKAWQH